MLVNFFVLLPVWIAVTIPGVFFCLFFIRLCLSAKICSTQGLGHNSYSTHRTMLNITHFCHANSWMNTQVKKGICVVNGVEYASDMTQEIVRITTKQKSQWTWSFMGMFVLHKKFSFKRIRRERSSASFLMVPQYWRDFQASSIFWAWWGLKVPCITIRTTHAAARALKALSATNTPKHHHSWYGLNVKMTGMWLLASLAPAFGLGFVQWHLFSLLS